MTAGFWAGRRVLLTGHTGFKGSWLTLCLSEAGARVTGISLPPSAEPSLFTLAGLRERCDSRFCDIRDAEALVPLIRSAEPEVVFHLAAQPLVRASYARPVETFASNVMGTANVLEALRGRTGARVAVMVTTDKVYQNREWLWSYREEDTLGGYDPYSASKAAAEQVIASYRASFLAEQGVAVASARAGNVIGGGDWSEDRLLPDAVRAWSTGKSLHVRRPSAVRPWQHVLDPLAGYMKLAEALWERPELSGAYNFGPEASAAASVREVVELARASYGKGGITYALAEEGPHEAGQLSLDPAKARAHLGVSTRWPLADAVTRTMTWYRARDEGGSALELCLRDMAEYGASA